MKFLVFDTETTGLPKRSNASPEETYLFPYIVQLSWLIFNTGNNRIEHLRDKIIKLPHGIQIPKKTTEIHGITQKIMLEDGEPIVDVLNTFMQDASACTYIVAHNMKFDKTLIDVECIRNKFSKRLSDYRKMEYCTMKKGKIVCNIPKINHITNKTELKYPKLIELHEFLFHETPKNLHNSLIDILVCFRCFYALVYNVDVVTTNKKFKEYLNLYCGL